MSMVSRRRFLYSLGVVGAGVGLGLASVARNGKVHEQTETRLMMGTFVTITARNESQSLLNETLERTFSEISQAEAIFTRHDGSSPLGVLNTQGALRNAPNSLVNLLEDSLRLAERTQGGFNPATVPVLGALSAHEVSSINALPGSVQRDLELLTDHRGIIVRGNSIRLAHNGMGVSLDGIAKGHIVDMATTALERHGITDYLVNAGGDIRVGGQEWVIGIQDGANPGKNITHVRLNSGAMATSGNYESLASKGYSHLVQADRTDLPMQTSVTVTAPTCAEADSLATALFAMGVKKGMSFIESNSEYACLWQTANGLQVSGKGGANFV